MINLERYLKFLVENKLTQQQFIFLHLLYTQSNELINLYRNAFPTETNDLIGKNQREDLIERGFVVIEGDYKLASSYKITDKFLNIFVDCYRAGNEFWDSYPAFVQSGGKLLPLTLMDKNHLRNIYWKAINGSREEHNEVLIDLKYAVDNSLIKGKIENFVLSEQWTQIRKIRLNQEGAKVSFKVEDNELI